MKTQQEIVDRIKELAPVDFMGFQRGDLIDYLDFEHAKEYLKDGVTADQWTAGDQSAVEQVIRDYLPFAWGKANDNRGLSAGRSIEHFLAWTWLIDTEFYSKLMTSYQNNYQYYGKPQLVLVSEHYGFDWKAHDDNRWTNDECGTGITAEKALAA